MPNSRLQKLLGVSDLPCCCISSAAPGLSPAFLRRSARSIFIGDAFPPNIDQKRALLPIEAFRGNEDTRQDDVISQRKFGHVIQRAANLLPRS